jgi:adenylate kinase family enzyme
MRRVAIIGNAGGDPLRERRLAADLGVPYHGVDMIQWLPGWHFNEDFDAHHDAWLKEPGWVIDGIGPWAAVERRFDYADTVLWIDLPLATHLWWATKRIAKDLVGGQADLPPGCSLIRAILPFYRMIFDIHRNHREAMALMVERARDQGKAVHVLRTTDQIARFRAGAWKFATAA